MCACDMIEHRKNSWELYGFDFMIDENFHPWLIEINSSPACDYSTKVTERYVQKALVEILAVVLDLRKWEATPKKERGEKPSTGGWQCIYRGPLLEKPFASLGSDMTLKGQGCRLPRSTSSISTKKQFDVALKSKTVMPTSIHPNQVSPTNLPADSASHNSKRRRDVSVRRTSVPLDPSTASTLQREDLEMNSQSVIMSARTGMSNMHDANSMNDSDDEDGFDRQDVKVKPQEESNLVQRHSKVKLKIKSNITPTNKEAIPIKSFQIEF